MYCYTLQDGQYQNSKSPKYSYIDLERIKEIYEFDTSTISSAEQAESFKEEQKIYDTPYEDEVDYGPIYTEPPNKVEKIYESIDSQIINELDRGNIR